jgi:hypothetical protein
MQKMLPKGSVNHGCRQKRFAQTNLDYKNAGGLGEKRFFFKLSITENRFNTYIEVTTNVA